MKIFGLLLFFVSLALAAFLLFTELFAPHEVAWWIGDVILIIISIVMMGMTPDGFDLFDGWDDAFDDFGDTFSGGDWGGGDSFGD